MNKKKKTVTVMVRDCNMQSHNKTVVVRVRDCNIQPYKKRRMMVTVSEKEYKKERV